MMMIGSSASDPLDLADQRQAVHARHPQVGDQQVVVAPSRTRPSAVAGVGRGVDVVFRQRQRLRQQIADARFVVHDEHARAAVARGWRGRGRRRRRPTASAGCPARRRCRASGTATGGRRGRRESSRLDQPVDGAQVDLEVLEDLFGRQKHFVGREVERQACHILARSTVCRAVNFQRGNDLRRKIVGDSRQPVAAVLSSDRTGLRRS